MALRVLIIEDSEDDAELTLRHLKKGGYTLHWLRVESESALREALSTETWDIIISDYSLPQFDAPSALKVVNDLEIDIPFIIVSGTIGEETAVTSLRAGARDFLVKGHSHRLVPAIERELREAEERRNRQKAETELKRSEHRFAKAFQMSPTAITITHLSDNSFVDVNDSFLEIVGYSRDEVIGHSIEALDFLGSPAEQETIQANLRAHGKVTNRETTLRHRSGDIRTVIVSVEIIDLDGVPCALSQILDITERKRAESAIRESEERFRLLAENSTDIITRQTPEGIYLYVSPACSMLLGYLPEELIGHSIYERIHPEDRESVVDATAPDHASHNVDMLTYRIQHKSGDYIWLETTRRKIYAPETQELIEIQTASRDVSERKRAEEILRQSEERFRLLVNGIDEYAIYLLDANGRVASWNPGAEWLKGYKESDVLGKSIEIFYTPEDRAAAKPQRLLQLATEMGHVEDEGWRIRKDGSRFWADVSINSLRADDQSLYGFTKIVRDLTPRKVAEETLRRYNQRLTMLHTIDQSILTTQSVDTIIQFVLMYFIQQMSFIGASIVIFDFAAQSGTVSTIYQHTPEPITEHKAFNISHWSTDDLRKLKLSALQPIASSSLPKNVTPELQLLREAGFHDFLRIPLVVQDQLIGALNLAAEDFNLAPPEYAEIAQEIAAQIAISVQQWRLREQILQYTTELELRVEERTADLNRSKERVEAILNNSSDAILFLSVDGIIQQVNAAFYRLFGYPQDNIFGMSLMTLVEPEDADQLRDTIEQLVAMRRSSTIDLKVRRYDGTTFDADIAISTMRNNHHVPGLVCSVRDITERKQAEIGLRQALEKERELNELKSRFVSMASHEFRTPLASILSAANMLADYRHKMDSHSIDEKLNRIMQQVQYLASIMNDVLDLGRLQSGHSEFKPVEVDLDHLCQEILDEFNSNPENQHEFVYHSQQKPLFVTLDVKLMRQVIINLISNAQKYSPLDSPVFVMLENDADTVTLRVRDQGIGIPDTDLKHLFEPFHRAKNVGSVSGTGLGLSIIQQAINLHDGTVNIESTVGQGTTFIVTIPTQPTDLPESDSDRDAE